MRDSQKKDWKRIVYGILFALALLGILFLTLQSPAGTLKLSRVVRLWLKGVGIKCKTHVIRKNAHLVEYFVLGIVLSLYGRQAAWKRTTVLISGSVIGLLDECLKVFLPTREFEFDDWVRDCVGIVVAVLLFWIIQRFVIRHHKTQK